VKLEVSGKQAFTKGTHTDFHRQRQVLKKEVDMNFYGDQSVVRPRYKQLTSIPATPIIVKRLNSADKYSTSNKADQRMELRFDTYHPRDESFQMDPSLTLTEHH
jgi:hypothetical protein